MLVHIFKHAFCVQSSFLCIFVIIIDFYIIILCIFKIFLSYFLRFILYFKYILTNNINCHVNSIENCNNLS